MRLRPLLVLVAGFCAAASPGWAACQMTKLAELPVTMMGRRPTVAVKINGHPTTMMVDTGAFFSGVSDEAAARFGMQPTGAPVGMRVHGVGGAERGAKAVRAKDFEFAGATLKDYDFLVGGRVIASGVDGMLGENLLGTLDVEYDLAGGAIRMFKVKDCPPDTDLAYWAAGKAVSRVGLADKAPYLTQLIGSARVNGQPISVVFDSGSPYSVLSRAAAARAGVQAGSEGVLPGGVTYGAYGAGVESLIAPFRSFAVGAEEVRDVRLRVADIGLTDGDMLLGVDFFLSHHMLVSRSQHRLYFTSNDGAARPPESGISAGSELSRRAAADVARGDYPAALEALGQAIALEPSEARYRYERAMARLGVGQPQAALADLDAALQLRPDDARMLMARGQLYAQARDAERAKADFDAAMRLQPGDSALPLQAAQAYLRIGDYEPAIRIYDRWLTQFPKDESVGQVTGLRCNARAAWGQELEAGLADCDVALRRDGGLSTAMESRGVILLRMGRLDEAIAQFDAALRIQPRAAWSLYGRGLAKRRKGATAQGDADVAAALALRPGLTQEALQFGLISR